MFGRKKPEGKTVLVLDIESGSVAAALVRITPGERPGLFGETRSYLPLSMQRSGSQLTAQVNIALKDVLQKVSEIASRFRNAGAEAVQPMGVINKAVAFYAAPWGVPDLALGTPQFLPDALAGVRAVVESRFGKIQVLPYTTAGLGAFGQSALFGKEPEVLYIVGGEVSEMLHHDGVGVRGHATLPFGYHTLLRTLQTHGGLSELEARSAAQLPFSTPHLREPFMAAAAHLGGHATGTMRELLAGAPTTRVRVMGEEAAALWVSHALTSYEPLGELFPQGGELRSLRRSHMATHFAAHQPTPDLRLMLAGLFADQKC